MCDAWFPKLLSLFCICFRISTRNIKISVKLVNIEFVCMSHPPQPLSLNHPPSTTGSSDWISSESALFTWELIFSLPSNPLSDSLSSSSDISLSKRENTSLYRKTPSILPTPYRTSTHQIRSSGLLLRLAGDTAPFYSYVRLGSVKSRTCDGNPFYVENLEQEL